MNNQLSRAIDEYQNGNLDKSLAILHKILSAVDNQINILLIIGLVNFEKKDYFEAEKYLCQLIQIEPTNIRALQLLSDTLVCLEKYEDALNFVEKLILLGPVDFDVRYKYGLCLYKLARYSDALTEFNLALEIKKDLADVWLNRGATLSNLSKLEDALQSYIKATTINPNLVEAWSNIGIIFNKLKEHQKALEHYQYALKINPHDVETLSNQGLTYIDLGRYENALSNFDEALQIQPDYIDALINKGLALIKLRSYERAIDSLNKALKISPSKSELWKTYGLLYYETGQYAEALSSNSRALELAGEDSEILFNQSILLNAINKNEEAGAFINRAIQSNSKTPYLAGYAIQHKLNCADWANFEIDKDKIIESVKNDQQIIDPFIFLLIQDCPKTQLTVSANWVNNKFPEKEKKSFQWKNSRIRVAYISSDFKSHAVSYLTAKLFEVHDRSKFEVFGFFTEKIDHNDLLTQRLIAAFEHSYFVYEQSDLEVAKLLENLQIDIAIDLGGHTQKARTGIFAYYSAKIQINYLGFPGTMGAPYVDYIIGDAVLIPAKSKKYYSEKIIYMPNCFQCNDSDINCNEIKISRSDLGIQEDSFIFCCLNNSAKINPDIFSIWLRILKSTPNSCLYLLGGNETLIENLTNQAIDSGLTSDRIIFGPRLSFKENLARYALMDLFLDTHPFNAGATASDALRAGLPLLTKTGESYAARMATSLLSAIDLPELITTSWEDYERIAIEIGSNKEKLNHLKIKLNEHLLTLPLLNTILFARNLENAFSKIIGLYESGKLPEDIYLN